MRNLWDNLAGYFSGSNASSSDNIEIIEPVLIEELKKIDNLNLIDFGCGSGNFCKRVSPFARRVLGIDSSKEMIKTAKEKNKSGNTEFTNKPIYDLDISSFNVLNAEFVTEFMPDEELSYLLDYLAKSSIRKILMANDRYEFIKETIKRKVANYGIDDGGYTINLNGNIIRIYPRSSGLLKSMFQRRGFELERLEELGFPEEFLKRFPEMRERSIGMDAYSVFVFGRK
ncbi:class I SAM-dependent methyltransferase [Candidatus Woesearchaeota archaeon]|nr:class I SAM-dependent methyltransferase [Candidatus Woesearchaeota archaeon]